MLDINLEPDLPVRYRYPYPYPFLDPMDLLAEAPSDEEIEIALHNYECMVYNELDLRIWRQ
jgi:hypothetical protein